MVIKHWWLQKEQEREKKKAARKKARERLQNQKRDLAGVVKDAEKRQAAYDKQVSAKNIPHW